jgi:PII-like signaling protein
VVSAAARRYKWDVRERNEIVLAPGPAKKVTIHLNADTSSHRDYLSSEILSLLFEHGVAGATVTRPEAGFGSHHRMHTRGGGIDADRHMPLQIEFIESKAKLDAFLPRLEKLLTDGIIEAHDTTILKVAMDERHEDRREDGGGEQLR